MMRFKAKEVYMMFRKYRFLLFRRVSQLGIMVMFIICNHYALSYLNGSLSASSIFGLPMSDPLSILQIFASGVIVGAQSLLGFTVVLVLYGLFFGRAYCAFVCPMNLVTDLASFLRRFLGVDMIIKSGKRKVKYYILGLCLIVSFISGVAAFDIISPISILYRNVIFGFGFGMFVVLVVFLFDLFVLKNGFCGYICPLGATYSIIGKYSLLRVKHKYENCTKCMNCVRICPEAQVLDMIGKRSQSVDDISCIKCGRCIEVCNDNALSFGILNFK